MMIDNLTVERIEDSRLRVSWEAIGNGQTISIYCGDSPDRIDYQKPIATVDQTNMVELQGLNPDFRHYFSIVSEDNEKIIASERLVNLEGTLNFRDLGGYKTNEGRTVKWGKLFRSDSLARLTNRDHILLKKMGLKLVCDFRANAEIETSPDKLPEDDSIDYLHLPVSSSDVDTVSAIARLKKGDTEWLTESFMREGYIRNIDRYAKTWGLVFNNLTINQQFPLVFHCTAGKDRTGACAALLLLILGVPEDTILQDHGLSNFFLAGFLEKIYEYFEGYGVNREKISSYLTAPQDAIIALLNHIRNKYGSAENYLITMAGVNQDMIHSLRRDFLE